VMTSNATRGTDTPTEDGAATPAHHMDAEEAFPSLPQDVVVTHILRADIDPIVLARLRAVNRAMRDAVDETELLVEEMATEEAAELGCLDTLQHKLEKGRLTNKSQVCECAAKGGQLEVLQWARVNGCPWDWATCAWAARGGHMYVLQWARANGCPWSDWTCARAAQGGHLEVLQWARANGCQWNHYTCSEAAEGGHLEVLQWARVNGCPWNEETCSAAAYGGHLEVLLWARANGCPWDQTTCAAAAASGRIGVLQWAIENGCPWDWFECMSGAIEFEHLDMQAWLNENKAPELL
jgi:hypothetical protein